MPRYRLILAIIMLVYLANGVYSVKHWSVTWDENAHLSYAIRLLKGQPERVRVDADNSKMPVTVLNTLPRIAEQLLHPKMKKSDGGTADVLTGRYITLFFSLLTILLVFRFAAEWYGEAAGLFAALLMSICPNNLAASVLVTTDAYSSFFMLATIYTAWKFCASSTTRNFILFAVCIALSQVVKQSLTYLYLLSPLCIWIYWITQKKIPNRKKIITWFFIFIAINWLLINAAYLFYKPFTAIKDYHFYSDFFISLQHMLPGNLPVPAAQPYITGLDMAKYCDQIGGGHRGLPESSFGNVTILGHSKTGGGFWYYYFVTFFYKTPVGILIFLAITTWYTAARKKMTDFFAREFFLLLPVLFYFLLFNFMYNTQCGVRHIVFLYPPLFVFVAGIIPWIAKKGLPYKAGFAIITAYACISSWVYFKNTFAYTNEFITDKTMAYDVVGVSNISFNQGGQYLAAYMKEHPEVQFAPLTGQKGKFILMLDDYADIWNYHRYDWLKKYKPVAAVANGCYLVFDCK